MSKVTAMVIRTHFDAAHHITGHPTCGDVHGHRWGVTCTFAVMSHTPSAADRITQDGMVVDFKSLKTNIQSCLPDHKDLNAEYGIDFATCEVVGQILFNAINKLIREDQRNRNIALVELELSENPECSVVIIP